MTLSTKAWRRRQSIRGALTDTTTTLLAFQALTAGTAFVANIAAARTLEPAGRGELALLLQIAYLATLGVLLGTDRSVVTTCSGCSPRTVARVAARLLWTPGALVLPVTVVVLVLPVPGLADWRVGLAFAALFTVVNAFTRAVRAVAIAAGRRREYLGFGAATAVLMLVSIGVFVAAGVTSSAVWMVGYVVAGLIPTVVLLARWARTPDEDRADEPDLRSRARKEGLALLPATVAHSGTLRIDRLLLAGLASTTALGIYATVATMTELIAWPLLAYADSRLGRWREAFDAGTFSLRRVLLATASYSVLAAVVVAVGMHLALVPLLGEEYASAQELIGPLVLAAVVFGVSQILVTALTATRRAARASVVEVSGVVVSVIAYVVLIEQAGALGAAWGSVVGYAAVGIFASAALLARSRKASS